MVIREYLRELEYAQLAESYSTDEQTNGQTSTIHKHYSAMLDCVKNVQLQEFHFYANILLLIVLNFNSNILSSNEKL